MDRTLWPSASNWTPHWAEASTRSKRTIGNSLIFILILVRPQFIQLLSQSACAAGGAVDDNLRDSSGGESTGFQQSIHYGLRCQCRSLCRSVRLLHSNPGVEAGIHWRDGGRGLPPLSHVLPIRRKDYRQTTADHLLPCWRQCGLVRQGKSS